MSYLNWGCDPLNGECQSCLDAYCNVCNEVFKQRHRHNEDTVDPACSSFDPDEPDCDHCNLEQKPDCAHCEIILAVCRGCAEHDDCGFRICGDE